MDIDRAVLYGPNARLISLAESSGRYSVDNDPLLIQIQIQIPSVRHILVCAETLSIRNNTSKITPGPVTGSIKIVPRRAHERDFILSPGTSVLDEPLARVSRYC